MTDTRKQTLQRRSDQLSADHAELRRLSIEIARMIRDEMSRVVWIWSDANGRVRSRKRGDSIPITWDEVWVGSWYQKSKSNKGSAAKANRIPFETVRKWSQRGPKIDGCYAPELLEFFIWLSGEGKPARLVAQKLDRQAVLRLQICNASEMLPPAYGGSTTRARVFHNG